MPLLLTILALDAIFVLHAAMTERSCRWLAATALPLIGALAYIVFEMIPNTETRLVYHTHPDR